MLKYKKLSSYLQSILQKNGQIKSIVYSKNFPFNVAASFSLFSTCQNNVQEFQKFKNAIEQLQKVDITNKYLFFVMLAEYLNTGKIIGGGKIKRTILNHIDKLNIKIKNKIIKSNVQIRVKKLQQIEQLLGFKQDNHVPGVYDLSYLQYSDLRKKNQSLFANKLIVQSKSSCLPAWLLFQDLNFSGKIDIIDCCSAPGNKTLQLSQYIGERGKVLAFEKNEQRYSILKKRMKQHQANNIKTFNQDFLLSETTDEKFKRVKLVLADPSCSGSGMLVNFSNHQIDQTKSFQEVCQNIYNNLSNEQKQRVQNLKTFQLSILNHCAQFKPARISYSTCSIYQKQNEEVVREFLESNPEYRIKKRPQLIDDLPRGFGEIGKDCVRMSPLGKHTDGFFVCIFKLK